MKLIGRILLIAAAVLLAIGAVPGFIDTIKYFNEVGWVQLINGEENISRFVSFLGHAVNLLFAVIALLAALVGKKSFLLALTAIILMIAPVMTIVGWVQAGLAFEWDMVLRIITGFTAPVLYFLGFLFV
ncbi:MAG: hypothetical protein J6038_02565 [Bacilli bacterium]|nr:hypothetical protein [Bacilli bacterium]